MRSMMALYGNVRLERARCPDCGRWAFVRNGSTACCGVDVASQPTRYKRISQPEQRRRRPPLAVMRKCLEDQGDRCFYCDRRFGSAYVRGSRIHFRTVHWDHLVPYSLSQDNRSSNFVAACNVCNLAKQDRCYASLEQARIDLCEYAERLDRP